MTEFLSSFGPTERALIVIIGGALAWLVLVELGVLAISVGAIGGAWLHSMQGWPTSGAVAAGVAGALLFYVAASVVKPNAPCVWCKGSPRRGVNSRGRWRGCFLCGGSGRRHPLGSKILRRNRRFLGTGG